MAAVRTDLDVEPLPDRLDALPPDVHLLPAGTTVWRIYFRGGPHPTRWNRFRRVGPTDARFDHQLGYALR